jgi:hypothetical protein
VLVLVLVLLLLLPSHTWWLSLPLCGQRAGRRTCCNCHASCTSSSQKLLEGSLETAEPWQNAELQDWILKRLQGG